ncbi:hypothetical protein FOCC_FOCC009628 [Frankliniella occidentalis]|nr:hypothetical protein FOCC_FOCC009628 [Frankliniella occidentalis]
MDDDAEEQLLNLLLMGAGALLMMMDDEEADEQEPVVWEGVPVDINHFLQMRNEAFRLHFRMNTETFEDLVHVIVLWILATPDTFRSVAMQFELTPALLHFHYAVIIFVLSELSERYVRWPLPGERNAISDVCEARSGFPGVVGAVDASYIPLCTAPVIEAQRYVNRHHDYAVSLQGVVDPALVFRDIYVGEPGSLHDSRVFRRSPLSRRLLEDDTLLDQDQHILGDSAYILTDKVLTPYRNNGNLTVRQTNYNAMLSSSRSMVERAFGLLKMKWRRLFFLSARKPVLVVRTIVASVVLHNFLILRGEAPDVGEPEEPHGNVPIDHPNVQIEPDHPLLAGATARGVEKRYHITNNLPL